MSNPTPDVPYYCVCVCMCVLLEGVVVVGRGTHELQCPGAPGDTIPA